MNPCTKSLAWLFPIWIAPTTSAIVPFAAICPTCTPSSNNRTKLPSYSAATCVQRLALIGAFEITCLILRPLSMLMRKVRLPFFSRSSNALLPFSSFVISVPCETFFGWIQAAIATRLVTLKACRAVALIVFPVTRTVR
jgi:hypothetical protein